MKTTLTLAFLLYLHPVALRTEYSHKKQRAFSHAGPHFYTAKVSGIPGPKCIWEQDTALSPVGYQVFDSSVPSNPASSCRKSSGIQLS